MIRENGVLFFTATDIANNLGCEHLTTLDRRAVDNELKRIKYDDPFLDMLRERGLAHEKAYVDSLAHRGCVDLSAEKNHVLAEAATHAAMARGDHVIVQAALSRGRFRGRPDVLLRVETKSDAWDWAYEVHDTKLTENTRAGAILQLCLYWKALADIQGEDAASHFFIKTPTATHPYRALDYTAYFDAVSARLIAMADAHGDGPYPEPVEQCDVCAWSQRCDARRRDDDHLSFVARATRSQRNELNERGITRLEQLGQLAGIDFKPKRGRAESLDNTRRQAAIQLLGRTADALLSEHLELKEHRGFALLPPPTPDDVYIDFEGDQFALPYHRDYMLGLVTTDGSYTAYWALHPHEERQMFEDVMAELMRRLDANKAMHVYHYAHYENTAFKRLAQRYGVQQDNLDKLLRGERFVDLYKVVTQSIRASVESYSIKQIEKLAGFRRKVDLKEAGASRRRLEFALETGRESAVSEADREAVRRYNDDDCQATRALHGWLLGERAKAGVTAWPALKDTELVTDDEKRAQKDERDEVRAKLLEGVPDVDRNSEQQTRWLMAHLLEFHQRESKVEAWARFERIRLMLGGELDALADDKEAIASLKHEGTVARGQRKPNLPTDRYSFPPQDADFDPGDDVAIGELGDDGEGRPKLEDRKLGTVVAVDIKASTVDIKKTGECAKLHPEAVIKKSGASTRALQEALLGTAKELLEGNTTLAIRLLQRQPPRVALVGDESSALAVRVATQLRDEVLPIQGPPGAGKTHTAAKMIAALVANGKRVGVTSNSHKAIRNLLRKVREEVDVGIAHKCDADFDVDDGITNEADPKKARFLLTRGEVSVLGGTAWLWAGQQNIIDVLFVDEAGQMALANVMASASAASSIVLLGDPQQLEQPTKAAHPEGVAVSALEHLFGGARVVPEGRGIFLDKTYRLPHAIADFTSELFYDSQLGTAAPTVPLRDCGPFDGNGLFFVPCAHDGNRNASDEEVQVVCEIVSRVEGGRWGDKPLSASDIMVIAPYNAQVARLKARLPHLQIGTVDLFQGREAPVVIFSMATSTAAEAPRGKDFLFSGNRLNVATSRARAACILVANPPLMFAECRTPEELKLVNAFCRYRQVAREVILRRNLS